MNSLAKIGFRIKMIRERMRLNQASFGTMLGLSGNAISAYETSDAIPPVKTLVKIAEIGSVTIGWLIMGEEQEPKLSSEDLIMLSIFRQLPPEERVIAIRMLEVLATKDDIIKK